MEKKILIVGGVAGGASAAARLRRLDEHARIILFEKGKYISFANCGLPYYIGGEIKERADLLLQTPESFYNRFGVDVRVHSEVTAIDRAGKRVCVKNHQTGESYYEGYDTLILSPGAQAIKPPIPGMDSARVFTLRTVPDTDKIKDFIATHAPRSAAVIGGGYIGVEMAENLKRAGLEVTLVEMQNQVIAPLDYDMACKVHDYIESKGITLRLTTALKAIHEEGDELHLALDSGVLAVDMVLLSIGVRPETALSKAAGLKHNDRGALVVDERMRTSDAQIYAVGDAVEVADFVTGEPSFVPLAGPANKQGRIAADQICAIDSRYKGTQGSAIVKVFDMTIATTGINEKTAKRLGMAYDKVFVDAASHATYYPGAQSMTIKALYAKDSGKILGAQVVGFEGCDKRCDVLATAIRFGATAKDLAQLELCYAPPFSSAKDPVNMVGFVVENLRSGKVAHFHWDAVDTLPRDGSVTLLDVRTPTEYALGHPDGFINIPVDKLRERMSELDKGKPVYLTCRVGQRGYIACRLLSQHGFDCYNLEGGYLLYRSIVKAGH